jgi:regulator of protease activity HflC (stomatin/prohibitin superfamily)
MEDSGMPGGLWVVIFLAGLVLLVISKTARVVPQQSAYVVERLGRYSRTLGAGFHILWPFLDSVQYKHSLKETAIDIPEQICITRDNVQVGVDGILYSQGAGPAACLLRHQRLPLRHHAARSDRAPQRDRQNRTRPHL